MKIIRDGDTRLEVVNSYYFLPAIAVFFGGGFLWQELPKFFCGQEHLSDRNYDVGLAAAVLFIVVGLFQWNRFRACFDKREQTMTWTQTTIFGRKVSSMSLGRVRDADFELGANMFNDRDHPNWGPLKRVVIRTEDGLLPLAGGYNYGTASQDRVVAAINEFLGVRATEPSSSSDDAIRKLVAEGAINQAIASICERDQCPPSKAREIVEQMMQTDF
ncbi:MAG TPA: hypothetical protein VHY09_02310 [Candidatus Methylacidiphilales bacterium]|jgi:hypothetical protein|nr:hypothetical protein [Candidatus Methylacidiphilales bacterium]